MRKAAVKPHETVSSVLITMLLKVVLACEGENVVV